MPSETKKKRGKVARAPLLGTPMSQNFLRFIVRFRAFFVFTKMCKFLSLKVFESPWSPWKALKVLESPWKCLKVLESSWNSWKALESPWMSLSLSSSRECHIWYPKTHCFSKITCCLCVVYLYFHFFVFVYLHFLYFVYLTQAMWKFETKMAAAAVVVVDW